jgi:long-chain acyl-CoA synthetase
LIKWRIYSTARALKSLLSWHGIAPVGPRKGDRVANVTETNRVEWNFIDGAVTSLGAIHLPIYPNISVQDYEFILNDSAATGVRLRRATLPDYFVCVRVNGCQAIYVGR